MSKMQHIDASSLSTHLPSRITYLQSFVAFTPSTDGELITSLKPVLAPLLPGLLDAIYTHLLSYDVTAASFMPAQESLSADGKAGSAETEVTSLNLQHANIKHRQDFLRAYLIRVLGNRDWSPESGFWRYLDNVGSVHTGKRQTKNKTKLRVELVHILALMAWLQNQIVTVVMGLEEGAGEGGWTVERKTEVVKAFSRFWWIQSDLFARHYCEEQDGSSVAKGKTFGLEKEQTRLVVACVLGVTAGFGLASSFSSFLS